MGRRAPVAMVQRVDGEAAAASRTGRESPKRVGRGRLACVFAGLASCGLALPAGSAGWASAQGLPAPEVQARDSSVDAGRRTLHPEAREAISRIRSPFCPGLMLEVCPSGPAQALRDSIDARAGVGLRADSLVEIVVASYGEEYRAVPKTSGAGLMAWVMPPLALAAGLGLVVVALRKLRRPPGAASSEKLSDDERAQVRAALAEFDRTEGNA